MTLVAPFYTKLLMCFAWKLQPKRGQMPYVPILQNLFWIIMSQIYLKRGALCASLAMRCVKGCIFDVDVDVYTDNRHIHITITSWRSWSS